VISHPPYSPDLAPADFFLFPKVKGELAFLTLTEKTFKMRPEGVLRKIVKSEFAPTSESWCRWCFKYIDYVEKS
jgi:hypothetical protein